MTLIFVYTAQDASVAVSIFTLTTLSLDRYKVVVRPVKSFVGRSNSKRIAVLIALIWGLSLGMALPTALFTYLLEERYNETTADDNGTPITREVVNQYCFPFPKEFGPLYPQIIPVMTRGKTYWI